MTNNDLDPLIPAAPSEKISAGTRRGRIQMILLLLVCASPVIASYFTFYVIKPEGGKPKVGQLVVPVQSFPLQAVENPLVGKWTVLIARPAKECVTGQDECVTDLHTARQLRLSMGREMARVQIVWLVTDDAAIDPEIQKAYDKEVAGFHYLRLPKDTEKRQAVLEWLARDGAAKQLHLIDPRGDRMMRFDLNPQTLDFKSMSKDLEKLLKWNPIGKAS